METFSILGMLLWGTFAIFKNDGEDKNWCTKKNYCHTGFYIQMYSSVLYVFFKLALWAYFVTKIQNFKPACAIQAYGKCLVEMPTVN